METEKLIKPFYRWSLWLVRRGIFKRNAAAERKLAGELAALNPGETDPDPVTFLAGRLAKALAVLTLGGAVLLFAGLISFLTGNGGSGIREVARPGYGDGVRETELSARLEGESEEILLSVQVSEQKYTKEEARALLEGLVSRMEEEILGENKSLDQVKTDLTLPETFENGTVKAVWTAEPADMISYDGAVIGEVPQSGTMVRLEAVLTCQEEETIWSAYVKLYPAPKTEKEEKELLLREAVQAADAAQAADKTLTLPTEAAGKKIFWEEEGDSSFGILFLLLAVSAAAVYVQEEKKLESGMKRRERQMIMDYPGLLYKMAMLLSAGLTIQGTFFRIAREYRHRKNPELHYVYEELKMACFEIRNGVGEGRAYENFGERCGLENYRKLGSLFAQNLRKGSQGLIEALETEAAAGMEARKQQAKKLGEEAGTKLLLPMMMMLVLVMGILIVPSVMGL